MEKGLPDFETPHLAAAVESLPTDVVNTLPFGVIRLDRDGRVAFYSETEARLSGYGTRPALGRDFFAEMAPCMRTAAFQGRIERARARGSFDMTFVHVGDFRDRGREIEVRVQSAADQGYWIFLRRR